VRLETSEAVACGIAMAEALAYAHLKGILHRDLKPANIIRTREGGIKITDFGVSKLAESSLATQEGMLLGSPAYMSPEQASGRPLDERSDLYAFGTVLYRMLVGRTPFEGDVMAVIAQTLTKSPPTVRSFIPDISPAVEEVVMRCLAKEPSERYVNLTEAAGALRYAASLV
jgi:serine/threonine protein kinase